MGEGLEGELLGDVQGEPQAGVADALDRRAERLGLAAGGVVLELGEPVAGVDGLGGAKGEAPEVAQPELGESEAVAEGAGANATLGAPLGLGGFALVAFAVAGGEELELGVDTLGLGLAGGGGFVAGDGQERQPGALLVLAVQRAADEALGGGAQLGTALAGEAGGEAGVAEGEAGAGAQQLGVGVGALGAQAPHDVVLRRGVQADGLAAGGDGGQDVAGAGGEQDEVDEGRGLLEGLQQAVGGLVVHGVGVLDDEDPPAGLEGGVGRGGDDGLVDVGDEHLAGAGGRGPGEIGVGATGDALGDGVGRAGAVGEEGGGEGAGEGALAGAGGPVEEVGVRGRPGGRQSGEDHGAGLGMGCERVEDAGRRWSNGGLGLGLGGAHGGHADRDGPGAGGAGCTTWGARRAVGGAAGADDLGAPPCRGIAIGYRPPMPRGRLITIEGIDGAGKTTLAESLARELARRGEPVELLREPGGVRAAEMIRELVKDPGLTLGPEAEALLYAAARAQLVRERLAPLLATGALVLLDRFVDSSLAYQGAGRELGVERVGAINELATGGLRPDRTLLLRISPATGRARQEVRAGGRDRMELEEEGFFARTAAAYEGLARAEPERFRVLDAGGEPAAVLGEALAALEDLL